MLANIAARNLSLDAKWGSSRASIWPATIRFGLFDGDPTGDGVEITGGGYAPVDLPNDDTTWAPAVDGAKVTVVDIALPTATDVWDADATWFAFSMTDGTLLEVGELTDVVSVDVGQKAVFFAGTITIIEPAGN